MTDAFATLWLALSSGFLGYAIGRPTGQKSPAPMTLGADAGDVEAMSVIRAQAARIMFRMRCIGPGCVVEEHGTFRVGDGPRLRFTITGKSDDLAPAPDVEAKL